MRSVRVHRHDLHVVVLEDLAGFIAQVGAVVVQKQDTALEVL